MGARQCYTVLSSLSFGVLPPLRPPMVHPKLKFAIVPLPLAPVRGAPGIQEGALGMATVAVEQGRNGGAGAVGRDMVGGAVGGEDAAEWRRPRARRESRGC